MEVVTTFNERLGENVRLMRQRAGLTQLQVAMRMEYSVNHIGKIERGHFSVPLPTLVKIARILKCSLAELLEGLEAYV